jgi:hypothetical protein
MDLPIFGAFNVERISARDAIIRATNGVEPGLNDVSRFYSAQMCRLIRLYTDGKGFSLLISAS